jgi:hypothetical protein
MGNGLIWCISQAIIIGNQSCIGARSAQQGGDEGITAEELKQISMLSSTAHG